MRNTLKACTVAVALLGLMPLAVSAQMTSNFADRKAVILNNATTYIELSGFAFENTYQRSDFRLHTSLKWKNVGPKPITAFEVVTLYYDPFNRPMTNGGRWMITGHDSGNWAPLGPGESSADGLIGFDSSEALTAVVYVRAIRFSDGTVWTSNQVEIEQKLKAAVPDLKEVGTLDPGAKKPKE